MEADIPAPLSLISVRRLTKVYRLGSEQVAALDSVSLEIPAGQVLCIVGTSGSGKSTLLNQLAGLEKPTKGQVIIAGKNIAAFGEDQLARFRQRNIGFVFQSYNLMPAMTALENVSMPLIFRGVGRRARNRAARQILDEVGLRERMRHKPSQMSGGQQQRVGIARAFVAAPKIVFADEPTGNLDTKTTIEVMRMMVRMARRHNQTLIIVTHDGEIAEYADRIVTIRDGRITDDRPNVSLAERPGDEQAMLERAAGQDAIAAEAEEDKPSGPDGISSNNGHTNQRDEEAPGAS